jgi:hypothetical protein
MGTRRLLKTILDSGVQDAHLFCRLEPDILCLFFYPTLYFVCAFSHINFFKKINQETAFFLTKIFRNVYLWPEVG